MAEESQIVKITDTEHRKWRRVSNEDPLIEVWQVEGSSRNAYGDPPSIVIHKRRIYREGEIVRVPNMKAKITDVVGDRVKLRALTRSGYVYWTLALDEIEPID